MQNAAFRTLKLNSVYVAFRVKGKHLEEALNGVRSLGIAGLNVTVPHKSAIIPYLDEVTPLALRVGAVNTIVNREGRLIGTSTDAAGFLRSLKETEFSPAGKSVVLLGAGGSARSLLAGLSEAGVQKIGIWNRTRVRAEGLIEEFKEGCRGTELKVLQDDKLDGLSCDLLINSTSAGMKESSVLKEVIDDPFPVVLDALMPLFNFRKGQSITSASLCLPEKIDVGWKLLLPMPGELGPDPVLHPFLLFRGQVEIRVDFPLNNYRSVIVEESHGTAAQKHQEGKKQSSPQGNGIRQGVHWIRYTN